MDAIINYIHCFQKQVIGGKKPNQLDVTFFACQRTDDAVISTSNQNVYTSRKVVARMTKKSARINTEVKLFHRRYA